MDFEKCMQIAKDFKEEYVKHTGFVDVGVDIIDGKNVAYLQVKNAEFMKFLTKYKIPVHDVKVEDLSDDECNPTFFLSTVYNGVNVCTIVNKEDEEYEFV